MSKCWFTITNKAEQPAAEILIYGTIGKDWDGEGTGAKEFREAFNAIPAGRKINVHINSPGGVISEGFGIYNTMLPRSGDITTYNDGYALSCGSFLMLAGDVRKAPKNAIFMTHKPSGGVYGDANDMRQYADILDVHQASIASIYMQRAGLSEADANALMETETWMDAEQAKGKGFVTELIEGDAATNAFDLSQFSFKNLPEALRPANANTQLPTKADNASDISGAVHVDGTAGATNNTTKGPSMDPVNAPAPAANTPPAATEPAPVAPVQAPANNVITLSTETITQLAAAMTTQAATTIPGAAPLNVRPRVENAGDAYDKYKEMKNGAERLAHVTAAWSDIHRAVETRKIRNEGNTIATELTTSMLASTVITTLGSKLAALSALFVQVSPDPLKPKAVIELPIVTDGATTQKNPTDWESGDSVIDNVSVTVDEYGHSFHLTNAQLQSGTQVAWLVRKNAIKFADYLMGVILTPVTTANFGDAVLVAAPAAFGPSDLPAVRAAGKNFTMKNLVLDGDYFSRVIPVTRDMLDVSDGGGQFGFDSIQENNYWPAAVGNVRGFVASPESMAIVLGLPIEPPGFGTAFNSVDVATIPGLNVSVQTASWVKPGTRVQWQAFDVMAGVSKADTTALKLITTA